MKYVDEYRDEAHARRYADAIARLVTQPWTVMEICGGQTHNLLKFGIDELLPDSVEIVHGPGCPVCVTPMEIIDQAIALAEMPEVILTSFGDMLRVPGSSGDLFGAKSRGGDVRIVYSPLEAVKIAAGHPDRQVVFFAVGFETTAPANAMAVWQAQKQGISNFSLLAAHVLVPPAIEALLSAPDSRIQGLLAAGHVCTVMGYWEYEPIAARHGIPIVVTGFEPLDLLQGLHMLLEALERGDRRVSNQYTRSVSRAGNEPAQKLLREVFEVCDRRWRGLGLIAASGLRLSPSFAEFDAEQRFDLARPPAGEPAQCLAGDVLRGALRPPECPAFGRECQPDHPLGAPMVSSEGACAAYYRYVLGRAPAAKPSDS
jgi:hydrogenase expression/formation protein HypD